MAHKMKIIQIFIICAASLTCTGCAQLIECYPPGSQSSPFDFAMIEIGVGAPWEIRNLDIEIDDQHIEWKREESGLGVYLQVLLGEHRIKWRYTDKQSIPADFGRTIKANVNYEGQGILKAEKGKFYDFHFATLCGRKEAIGSGRQLGSVYTIYSQEVIDKATWFEERVLWGTKVVVGSKPAWTDYHTCEMCGAEKAASPCNYGCYKCRSERGWEK